jgi:hypothetical protein
VNTRTKSRRAHWNFMSDHTFREWAMCFHPSWHILDTRSSHFAGGRPTRRSGRGLPCGVIFPNILTGPEPVIIPPVMHNLAPAFLRKPCHVPCPSVIVDKSLPRQGDDLHACHRLVDVVVDPRVVSLPLLVWPPLTRKHFPHEPSLYLAQLVEECLG